MIKLVAVLSFAAVIGTSLFSRACAEHWQPDSGKCHDQENTLAIVNCIAARTTEWDHRLNDAWKAVTTMLASDADMKKRMPSLKAAQLAWIKYRDLNCAYYGTDGGTIRQIEVADCMHDMTQARAIELQTQGPQ